jgi:hypothetical protein
MKLKGIIASMSVAVLVTFTAVGFMDHRATQKPPNDQASIIKTSDLQADLQPVVAAVDFEKSSVYSCISCHSNDQAVLSPTPEKHFRYSKFRICHSIIESVKEQKGSLFRYPMPPNIRNIIV